MHAPKSLLLSALSCFCMASFAADVQTVDWYKAHKAERQAVLAKCRNNPGELANTPDCVNASRAQSATTWGATGGIKAKPLTFPQVNNENCQSENIAKIANKAEQQELAGKCLRRGQFKASPAKSW